MLLATLVMGVQAQEPSTPENPVYEASITVGEETTNYATLAEAVNGAVAGNTVQLETDVTLAASLAIAKAVTIHLNSHVITGESMVADGAAVTFTDGATNPGGVLSTLSGTNEGKFILKGGRYYLTPAGLATSAAQLAEGYKAQALENVDGFNSLVLEMTAEEKAYAAYEAGTSVLTYTVNGRAQTQLRVATDASLTMSAPDGWKFGTDVTYTGCDAPQFNSDRTSFSTTPTDKAVTVQVDIVPITLAGQLTPDNDLVITAFGDQLTLKLDANLVLTLKGITTEATTVQLLDMNGYALSEPASQPYQLGKFTNLEAGKTYYLRLAKGSESQLVGVTTGNSD